MLSAGKKVLDCCLRTADARQFEPADPEKGIPQPLVPYAPTVAMNSSATTSNAQAILPSTLGYGRSREPAAGIAHVISSWSASPMASEEAPLNITRKAKQGITARQLRPGTTQRVREDQ
jgi:hypothetical protein